MSAQTRWDAHDTVAGAVLHPIAAPLHSLVVSWFVEAHVDEQVTVFAAGVHAPAVQPPAVQVALFVGHVLCGSLPAGTFEHVPGDEDRLHAWQPLHWLSGLLQQVLSTQLPDMHSP